MTLVLIVTCFFTPLQIAFLFNSEGNGFFITEYCIEVFYLIDIIVIFNTAVFDNDENLAENRKEIACHYLKGWFTIDIFSILPFELMVYNSPFNKLTRFFKIGKLYKLVKLTKLT